MEAEVRCRVEVESVARLERWCEVERGGVGTGAGSGSVGVGGCGRLSWRLGNWCGGRVVVGW